MDIDYARIGERIKYIRNQNRLSQEELAEYADVSPVYISNIERGEKSPSLKIIIAVANALNISTDSLLVDSLLAPGANPYSDLFALISDCTKEENDIIIENMRRLKEILRRYRISE